MKTALLAAALALGGPARAATVGGGQLVEDFSTLDYADLSSATTGVWNVSASPPQARVAAYADAAVSGNAKPITFGDGSDGILDTSGAVTFDTDAHPNGFNYQYVDITGAVTVTGTHALVIRSLGRVHITQQISLSTAPSRNGQSATWGTSTTPTGGTAVTCSANGGAGGTGGAAQANDGIDGKKSDGTPDAGLHGVTENGGPDGFIDGQFSAVGPRNANFDATFECGAGGAGGGSNSAAPGAAGAGGGAGGGRIHIIATGKIDIAKIDAKGGNGGNGDNDVTTTICSGNGAAGNGGAVWLQSLGQVSTSQDPDARGGASGSTPCNLGGSGNGTDGQARADSAPALGPAWALAGPIYNYFTTDKAPANTSSVVYSKAYDLKAWNANFASAPTITQTLNGGTITVDWAGSKDGVSFGSFGNLTALSNQGFRYVKFRITLTSAGAAAASPFVSNISLTYNDLGPATVDLKLAAGCGNLRRKGGTPPPDFFLPFGVMLLATFLLRVRRDPARRADVGVAGVVDARHLVRVDRIRS